jgi:hypothetical protein
VQPCSGTTHHNLDLSAVLCRRAFFPRSVKNMRPSQRSLLQRQMGFELDTAASRPLLLVGLPSRHRRPPMSATLQSPSLHVLNCSPSLVCAIWIESQIVQLSVRCECSASVVWRWSIRLLKGETLLRGTSDTRFAAQVAAQYALEQRLSRAGMRRFTPAAFEWKELLSL